jgi:hypothetical protein
MSEPLMGTSSMSLSVTPETEMAAILLATVTKFRAMVILS